MKKYKVVDAHGDIPVDIFLRREMGEKNVLDSQYYEKLQQVGMKVQVMAIYVEERYKPHQALEMALRQIEALLDDLDESKEFILIKNQLDLNNVISGNQIGVLLDMEGAEPIEGGIELLHLFYRLGVRMIGFTWNQRNMLANGINEEDLNGGLTEYGKEVLKECDRLGMMIDVSHLNRAGLKDILKYSNGNVLASHASSRTMYDIQRNINDDDIKEIAARDGIIGIPAFPHILSETLPDVDTVIDHISHLLKIAGNKHVGIGADFIDIFVDMINKGRMGKEWILPKEEETVGFSSVKDLPNLFNAMEKKGFSTELISDVAGENFLNFFKRALPK